MSPTELTTHVKLVERRVDVLPDLMDQILKSQMIMNGSPGG